MEMRLIAPFDGAKRRPGTKSTADAVMPAPDRPRALVVEAEPATSRLCREVLESCGFVVDAVESGIEAVVAAREGLPDVIVMDAQLRDVPGRQAVAWLRSNPALRSTPIIVLTADAEDDASLAEARPGASLRKPVSPITIHRMIDEVFKKRQ
jgi:two-component system chemotaxis response regulator CheY